MTLGTLQKPPRSLMLAGMWDAASRQPVGCREGGCPQEPGRGEKGTRALLLTRIGVSATSVPFSSGWALPALETSPWFVHLGRESIFP